VIEGRFGDGSELGLRLSYNREESLLGTAGGVRAVAGFLGDSFLVISGDALTDVDLAAMREFHDSHDGVCTLATKRVRDTSQFGVVITGPDGRIQGFQEKPDTSEALSDLANCGIYMFRSEVFDFFPAPGTSGAAGPDDPGDFADWAIDVFPALLEADVPFYSHEANAYWNDIGNMDELRQGNLDAVAGAVAVEPGAPAAGKGIWAASRLDGVEVSAPALVGAGVEFGEGARIDGPAVLGDGCRVGSGAYVREALLLEGADVSPEAMIVGGVAGRVTKA
jgi:mannose-1-phosphate guanylyltransferase/mannose-1-phosphate guanylyltransferase/phosphomannomutase